MSDLSHPFTVDGFTIKEANGRFFIAHTGTGRYGKPYATLRHACTATARKVEADYVERKSPPRLQQEVRSEAEGGMTQTEKIRKLNIEFWRNPHMNGRLILSRYVADREVRFHRKCFDALASTKAGRRQ